MGKFTLWAKTLREKDHEADVRALALRKVGLFTQLSLAFQQHVLIRISVVTIGRKMVNARKILATCFLSVQSVVKSAQAELVCTVVVGKCRWLGLEKEYKQNTAS